MQHIESRVTPLAPKSRQAIEAVGGRQIHDLMPIKAAAARLNVSEATIRRAFDAGAFPGLQIGRSYRVSRPFIEALLAEVRAGRRVVFEEFAAQWLVKASEGAA